MKPRRTLTIIVPCFNEQRTVAQLLGKVCAVDLSSVEFEKEIIAVDDGSTDGTGREIEAFIQSRPGSEVRMLVHPVNQGKGASIQTALCEATGEICLIQDGDLEYDPEDYPKLLAPIARGLCRVVFGSRWLAPKMPISGPLYALGGWLENQYLHMLYRTNLSDIATGYKVFETQLLRSLCLESRGFAFCPEVTAKLLNRREPIFEVPIRYRPRKKKEGKKICWTDFFVALYTLTVHRFARS